MKSIFLKTEKGLVGVQFYDHKPAICGDSISYLEEVTITWRDIPFFRGITYRKAISKAIQEVEESFPHYKGFLSIY
jgi:hypothetical protein